MKCGDICAGDLRESITLQHLIQTERAGGGYDTAWQTYATVSAKVHPVSSRDRVFLERVESSITHEIVIRYRTDMRTDDRAVWRDHPMKLDPPINIEARNRWLQISATIGQPIHPGEVET
jgi:SPP1 family predicted phage head-tail adaptor